MATKNIARACGLNSGTLDFGKLADVVSVNLDWLQISPEHVSVRLLVYCRKGGDIGQIIVNGQLAVRDGQSTQACEMEIIQDALDLICRFHTRAYLN